MIDVHQTQALYSHLEIDKTPKRKQYSKEIVLAVLFTEID